MKGKFEANVACDIPKTKQHEPALPWKLSEEEVGRIGAHDDSFRAALDGTPPLKTRPQFIILLVVTIFGITTYLVSNAIIENARMQKNIMKKDSELSQAQVNLMKAVAEKDAINKNSAAMQQKLSDLAAQKQLFASVIESLTKKGDDLDAVPAPEAMVAAMPANPAPAAQTAAPAPQAEVKK
jgi:hypothetical protein